MYGRRASQLLKEIDSSEAGQLVPFNVIPASVLTCGYEFGIIGNAACISFMSITSRNFVLSDVFCVRWVN
uniref:Uncharacterized protein n=1 Tax=Zea mays TaxID=4577 RepID=C0HE91_MAIZE|nr:unknown [Zea mays]